MSENEHPRAMRDVLVESARLLIRRPREEDTWALERVFCDPGMMRYLGGPWTAVKVAEALQEWHDEWGANNRWHGILLRKDTLEAVGTAGLAENVIPGEPGLEPSWFVVPEHQGEGFATEITNALLHFAFDGVGVERVIAETHPDNPASNRVLAKLRFECLGQRHHRYDYLPDFETQVLWELTRGNWRQVSSRRD